MSASSPPERPSDPEHLDGEVDAGAARQGEPEPATAVPAAVDGGGAVQVGVRHPFLVYNLLRLVLFLVVLAVSYLVGFRGLPLLAVALLVSGAVSFVVLNRIGGSAAASVGGMIHRLGERIDAGARAEDED